jgi:Flp pilus assembly pilin Flp
MLRNRRGQSILEYAILMVIVIAALLSLQTYIKRGIQGRLKQATDDIGEQFGTNTTFNKTTKSYSSTKETGDAGTVVTNTISSSTNVEKHVTLGLQNEEFYPGDPTGTTK